jgi:hypothetical protein
MPKHQSIKDLVVIALSELDESKELQDALTTPWRTKRFYRSLARAAKRRSRATI